MSVLDRLSGGLDFTWHFRVCSVLELVGMEWNRSIPAERNRSILVFGLDKKIVTEPFHSCVRFWNGDGMEQNGMRLIIPKLD